MKGSIPSLSTTVFYLDSTTMNKLKFERQCQVVSALCEGNSIRSIERMTGIHRDTIMRLGVRVGNACGELLDETMRNVPSKRLELDEIWTFVGKKQRHLAPDDTSEFGDTYTFVAIDPETKIVPAYRVGKRDMANTQAFIHDLAYRLKYRVQLSSDGFSTYVESIEKVFGSAVHYAQIVKSYESEPIGPGRYSPPKVTGTTKTVIQGKPKVELISTSYVERHNLQMRHGMRRFTRLTLGFSKKLDNLKAAVSLYMAHYNLVRRHGSLRMTPAMAAGIMPGFWRVEDLVGLTHRGNEVPSVQ